MSDLAAHARLDLVMPAHNEQHRIDRTLHAYRAVVPASTRLVVALDGCTDRTAAIVRRHAAEDDRVALLDFPKLGKGGVIAEAFRRCTGDVIGFVDADCATAPGELLRLARLPEGVDGAIACRRHAASVTPGGRSMARRITSTGFATTSRLLFDLPFADTQCGAKVLRREVVERALPFLSSRDLLFDVDLLVVARRLGFTIAEVPTVWTDRAGSRVHPVRDARRMLASSLSLWLHHRTQPIHPAAPRADAQVIDLRERAHEHDHEHADRIEEARAHA